MANYKDYFNGKKITLMGLGLLGRGMGDARFLAERGAKLIVTDLKSKKELKSSIAKLKKFHNIKYRLGEHKLEDFRNRDFILKAAGVPLDSPFIAEAKKNGIPIKMSTALFVKLSGATIVGVTGTRGKSTTAHLIYHILKESGLPAHVGQRAYLGGNVRGVSTLSLLKKIKPGDVAVLELDSWQLQGFGYEKISPRISVFTNLMPDHLNYYKGDMKKYFADKANIFKFQRKEDFAIAGKKIAPRIKTKGKKIIPGPIPDSWQFNLPGEHNRENASLAVSAAEIMGIPEKNIKKALASFPGVPGRLELVRVFRGIKIYNDTNSTTPDAAIVGLKSLGNKKKLVLIMGGADKKLNMNSLIKAVPRYSKKVILLPGTGTDNLPDKFKNNCVSVKTLKEAINHAVKLAKRGDAILFSPAFASFGMFKNEFDRGDKFNKIVKNLK